MKRKNGGDDEEWNALVDELDATVRAAVDRRVQATIAKVRTSIEQLRWTTTDQGERLLDRSEVLAVFDVPASPDDGR